MKRRGKYGKLSSIAWLLAALLVAGLPVHALAFLAAVIDGPAAAAGLERAEGGLLRVAGRAGLQLHPAVLEVDPAWLL